MERLSVIYASALFDIALQQDAIDDFLSQTTFLLDYLTDEDFYNVLIHPQISAAEKHEIFRSAFAEHINEDLLGFLYLVVDKNRELYMIPALKVLVDLFKRHNRIVTAKILSAAPYDDKQAESLREILSSKLDKQVELDLKVDPKLIGGPYIYVDGYYIDWTVKKRLHDLTIHMKEGCSV